MGMATCIVPVAGQQLNSIANVTSTQVQAAQKIFTQVFSNSSANPNVRTIPQMVGLAGNITVNFGTQLANVTAQAMACMAAALSG